ncbi:hypothetical protein CHU32_27915 [Superficieibacter electus]|uniref:Uncharacterized protein n=1 Tax=Superficieibacter electus TaxID=2022662 RepID=A0A2P5GGH4_9ENTR|nr:hypothetical protein CHU32_27915 [Superficieibacter electus]
MAHILLSGTYKSNNFSHAFIVCTLHTQLACKNGKESDFSTENSQGARRQMSKITRGKDGTKVGVK